MVGLPYPDKTDPELAATMAYLDQQALHFSWRLCCVVHFHVFCLFQEWKRDVAKIKKEVSLTCKLLGACRRVVWLISRTGHPRMLNL